MGAHFPGDVGSYWDDPAWAHFEGDWWGRALHPVPTLNLPPFRGLFRCVHEGLHNPDPEVREITARLEEGLDLLRWKESIDRREGRFRFAWVPRRPSRFVGSMPPPLDQWDRHYLVPKSSDLAGEVLERRLRELTKQDFQACPYHRPDWKLACEVLLQGWRERVLELDEVLAELPPEQRAPAYSLVRDPISVNIGHTGFTNGQHRSCALREQGVPVVLAEVH